MRVRPGRLSRSLVTAGLAAILIASTGATALATDAPDATLKPKATFDHQNPSTRLRSIEVKAGETFIVRIEHTCPESFDYPFEPLPAPADQTKVLSAAQELPFRDIRITHDDQFGGYLVSVSKKAAPEGKCGLGDLVDKLQPQSFVVTVVRADWNVALEGGFTFSGLTNPVYAVDTDKLVVEEPSKEDAVRLGAASFVSLFHDRLNYRGVRPSLAFGLGITTDSQAEYLLGLGVRFGDKASLIGGAAWGPVARLPNGVTIGTANPPDNMLANLGSQSVRSWFFALTYSFLSTDAAGRLAKPFAESKPSPPPATRPEETNADCPTGSLSSPFGAGGEERTVCLALDPEAPRTLHVREGAEWLSVTRLEGAKSHAPRLLLKVKAARNPGPAERTGKVEVDPLSFVVHQAAPSP
jgi:hypothetical protein